MGELFRSFPDFILARYNMSVEEFKRQHSELTYEEVLHLYNTDHSQLTHDQVMQQVECMLCGETREEQVGYVVSHVCDRCKEGKYVDDRDRACCVYCQEIDSAKYVLGVDDDGVYSHPQCHTQAVMYMIGTEDIDWDSLPAMPVEPINSIHAVCQCGEQHVYIDTIDGAGSEFESLDGFYCIGTNKFWREP